MGDPVCYLHLLDERGQMPERRIGLQRVYDAPGADPPAGRRVLVDRVWPRGVRRDALGAELWLRELGPSDGLRRWFGHRPERWDEFRLRYLEELKDPGRSRLVDELAGLARRGPLTLLYGAHDRRHNQAVVIREAIEERLA